jgi:WD40 repeat protein
LGYSEDVMLEAAAVSPSGRLVASAYSYGTGEKSLRVWDVETEEARVFPLAETKVSEGLEKAGYSISLLNLFFADDDTLYSAGNGGLRRWDLVGGSQEVVVPAGETVMVAELSDDRRWGLSRPMGLGRGIDCAGIELFDLAESTSRRLPQFGDCVVNTGFDSAGRLVVTGDQVGLVRVGDVFDGSTHVLAGHEGPAESVAISPDEKWVASTGEDSTLRIWPMPDLSKTPLQDLSREDLLAKLKSLTNVRAVRDAGSSTGWSIARDPFPGWKEVPEW